MTENKLRICQVNIRSLYDEKMYAIKAELSQEFDIICVTETNLPHARVTDLTLPGFHPILRKDRATGEMWGGVAVYAAEYISITRIYEYEIPDLEAMWVKLQVGKNTVNLCTCYRPPKTGAEFWTALQDSVDLVKQRCTNPIILTGDLNADPRTPHGHLLKLFAMSNNLTVHIDEPTRITPDTATVLDQVLSDVPSLICDADILDPISVCDHCPICFSINFKASFNKPKAFQRHVWDYKQADPDEFKLKLGSCAWDECFVSDNFDEVCEAWTTMFLNKARECIPNRVVTIRPCDKTFFYS